MPTIDRLHRDALAECIRQFFEGNLIPAETNRVLSLLEKSCDKTVRHILLEWNLFLEGTCDSPLEVTKKSWDAWQRCLLILESDRQIHCGRKFHWSRWQWVAAGATIFFAGSCVVFGFLNALIWLGVPLGVLSVLISRTFRRQASPYLPVVFPFDSFESLSQTYDEVKTFRKLRHPKPPQPIQLPALVSKAIETKLLFFWIVIFPTVVFLPFQMLPRFEATTRVE